MPLLAAIPEHDLAECRCSVRLHAGEDVLVDLHRERDAGVTEAFADDLDWDVGLEEEGGVCVPQVVTMPTRTPRSPEPHRPSQPRSA